MSGVEGLSLDADGFVDMDQFPDDGTDVAGPDLDALREALHSDPVDEPTAEEWDAMFDSVVSGDDGPFTVDGGDADGGVDPSAVEGADAAEGAFALDDDGTDTDDGAVEVDDAGLDLDDDGLALEDTGLDLDDTGLDDPLFDDGGLDLGTDDAGTDDYAVDTVADLPDGIANNDFEDFL